MKVAQLIDKLQSFDRELEVFPYTEEPEFVAEGHSFRLFHIEGVDVAEGELSKASDGVPSVKFGKSPKSRGFVVLHVTADF